LFTRNSLISKNIILEAKEDRRIEGRKQKGRNPGKYRFSN
jgi:hypothetical protein